jgi:transposase
MRKTAASGENTATAEAPSLATLRIARDGVTRAYHAARAVDGCAWQALDARFRAMNVTLGMHERSIGDLEPPNSQRDQAARIGIAAELREAERFFNEQAATRKAAEAVESATLRERNTSAIRNPLAMQN